VCNFLFSFHHFHSFILNIYRDLATKIEVTFVDKNQANDEGFTLILSYKMKYDEFAKAVGAHLNWNYLKLQFFRSKYVI
jgi:hypothetical protein